MSTQPELTYGGAPRSKLTLREIVERINDIIELHEGEVTSDLEMLELELEQKVEGYRYVMLEEEAIAEGLEKIAAGYTARAQARRKKAADLRARLQKALEDAGFDQVKTPSCTAFFKKSKKVVIADEETFCATAEDRFVRVQTAPAKDAIKKALDAGEEVEGAELVTTRSLQFR